jgi:curved DNA-binding protein CbpA
LSEAQKRTPRPAPKARDARSFPLSPTDGFVLSRVDGTLDEVDLAASTGLPEALVQASLAKLATLGLIVFDGHDRSGAAGPPPDASSFLTSSVQLRAAASATAATIPVAPKAAPSPPAAVEDVDLDADLRKRVADVHRELEQRDYYALLGVGEKADRKAIKRAYFELAAIFHPDRYFRKRLGSFKVQMEAIFARLTIAHEALSLADTRAEYDAYLAEQRRAKATEEHLANGIAQAKQAEETVERSVRAQEPAATSPPVSGATSPPPATPSKPPARVDVDVATRRDTLARRLLGGHPSRPPSGRERAATASGDPASGPPVAEGGASSRPSMPVMAAADAMNALRRRYEERVRLARAGAARKYTTLADAALASGDAVAAANAYRIAANLAADDADLERKARESRVSADALLSDTYMRQARYEETHDKWVDAARSWARVCKVSPDHANAHERAAYAILKSSGDLHEGVRFAQRACELEPKNPLFRIALANCYSAAGLALNARRELDTAAQLAPHDDTIQSMIRRASEPS